MGVSIGREFLMLNFRIVSLRPSNRSRNKFCQYETIVYRASLRNTIFSFFPVLIPVCSRNDPEMRNVISGTSNFSVNYFAHARIIRKQRDTWQQWEYLSEESFWCPTFALFLSAHRIDREINSVSTKRLYIVRKRNFFLLSSSNSSLFSQWSWNMERTKRDLELFG